MLTSVVQLSTARTVGQVTMALQLLGLATTVISEGKFVKVGAV